MQRQAEAIGIARFREQLFRLVRISARRRQFRHIGKATFRHDLARGTRCPFHHACHNRGAVNGKGKRLAHAHIPQWIAGERLAIMIGDERRWPITHVIQREIDEAHAINFAQRNALITPEAFNIRCRHLINDIYITREQCGSAAGIIGDHAVIYALPGGATAPMAIKALQFNPIARPIGHHAIRPGANRGAARVEILGRGTLVRFTVQHGHLRQIGRQQWRRAIGTEAQRVGINDLNARDRLRVGAEGPRAIHHERNAFQREGHILGGEIRSIMEAHTTAQRKFPGILTHRAPAFREGGCEPRL